jgi:hypothetical protein
VATSQYDLLRREVLENPDVSSKKLERIEKQAQWAERLERHEAKSFDGARTPHQLHEQTTEHHAVAVVSTQAQGRAVATVKTGDPLSIAFLTASIVIAVANLAVEVYKAYLMKKFEDQVQHLAEEVRNNIIGVVDKFKEVMETVQKEAKKLGDSADSEQIPEVKTAKQLIQNSSATTLKDGEATKIMIAGLPGGKSMEIVSTDGDSASDWTAGIMKTEQNWRSVSVTTGVAGLNYLKSHGEGKIRDFSIEMLAKAIGKESLAKVAEQIISVAGILIGLVELGFNIGKAVNLKETLGQLYVDYEKEAVLGPLKDVRYLMCGALSSLHKNFAQKVGSVPSGSDKTQLEAIATVIEASFTDESNPFNCPEFVKYPAPPAGTQPICRIYAPAQWNFYFCCVHGYKGCNEGCKSAASMMQTGGMSRRVSKSSAHHSRRLLNYRKAGVSMMDKTLRRKDGDANANDGRNPERAGWATQVQSPFSKGIVRQNASAPTELGDQSCGVATEADDFPSTQQLLQKAMTCECEMPITSLQQMYGTNLNQKSDALVNALDMAGIGGFQYTKYRPIVTSGHFGMRLFTPVIKGDVQSAQAKRKEMMWRRAGVTDLAPDMNEYYWHQSPYYEDVDNANAAEAFNFLDDAACRLCEKEGDQTKCWKDANARQCSSDGDTQGFLLTTYSKGAPVVEVKAECTKAELTECSGSNGFGTCGWRSIPKMYFPNTDLGKMKYCFLKAWHIPPVVGP